jgi:hypothetical protein
MIAEGYATEKEDHHTDDDHFGRQLFFQRLDGPVDEVRAVVGRHHLNAFGQSDGLTSSSLAFTRSMTFKAFSP